MTDDDVDGDEGSGTMDSDDYLDEAEINAMIRSFRRISKSGTRPRAYSKTRRISQVRKSTQFLIFDFFEILKFGDFQSLKIVKKRDYVQRECGDNLSNKSCVSLQSVD